MTEQPTQDEQWLPLSARENPEIAQQFEALHDGVPAWLIVPLSTWIGKQIGEHYIQDWWRNRLSVKLHRSMPRLLSEIPTDYYLDIIDCVISTKQEIPDYNFPMAGAQLNEYLKDGGSLFRASERGLERRVQTELQETADLVFGSGSRAAQYLRDAWQKAWGRSPDPSGAYGDSVRAVEAAYRPVVSPNNERATLGTIISNMRDKPTKFHVRLQSSDGSGNVARVVAMLELLWKSQFDRHGTDDETVPLNVSIEEAQDAVALVTILVHLAQQGGFTAAK